MNKKQIVLNQIQVDLEELMGDVASGLHDEESIAKSLVLCLIKVKRLWKEEEKEIERVKKMEQDMDDFAERDFKMEQDLVAKIVNK